MSNIFNLDAPIWSFMGEVADIIILALLWWIFSLGIITMGASTTALYYVLGKKIRKEQAYVAKDFLKSFKENLRQSAPLTLFVNITFVSLFLYIIFIIGSINSEVPNPALKILLPITLFYAFEVISFHTYTWALLSRFEMKSMALMKTAFLMTHKHPLMTLSNLGVLGVVIILVLKCPLLSVIAPGCIAWGQSFMIQNVFQKYIESTKDTKASLAM